jgi:hypothetical protein
LKSKNNQINNLSYNPVRKIWVMFCLNPLSLFIFFCLFDCFPYFLSPMNPTSYFKDFCSHFSRVNNLKTPNKFNGNKLFYLNILKLKSNQLSIFWNFVTCSTCNMRLPTSLRVDLKICFSYIWCNNRIDVVQVDIFERPFSVTLQLHLFAQHSVFFLL